MEPETTIEEMIEALEAFYKDLPQIIFLMKLSVCHKNARARAPTDADVVENKIK